MFNEKGTYLGRVEDPTTAKFAPFPNLDPDKESRNGVRKLVFKLWPARDQKESLTILLTLNSYKFYGTT